MDNKLINEKIKEVELLFESTKTKIQEHQTQVTQLQEELLRLQGEYRVLNDMKSSPKPKEKATKK